MGSQSWDLIINFAAAALAIMNPLGKLPVWTELTSDQSRQVRVRVALLSTATGLGLLLVFLLLGHPILAFLNIDVAAFRVAGGILVLLIAVQMVQGTATRLDERDEQGDDVTQVAAQRFRKIVVPFAVPMLAGPGSITTVVIYGTRAQGIFEYAGLAAVVVMVYALILVVLTMAPRLERCLPAVVFTVTTRVFGLLLAGIAMQLVLEGLGEVFPSWLDGTGSPLVDDIVRTR